MKTKKCLLKRVTKRNNNYYFKKKKTHKFVKRQSDTKRTYRKYLLVKSYALQTILKSL